MSTQPTRITWLMQRARRVLRTGRLAFGDEDYASAINRAYYAIFYAANAALSTRGLERSKHSGVVSEFRTQFVKTGLIEPQYSQFYGDAMDARQSSDYDFVIEPGHEQAEAALDEAQRFVDRIERFLQEQGYDSVADVVDAE
jgi:uncharacterized protein (UPF0332 family)